VIDFTLGFILGMGFWFWGLVILEFCLLTWFVECEWGMASLVSLGIFIFCLWWLADIPIWSWVKENPGQLSKYIGAYIVIGLVYSFIKYYFILNKLKTFVKKCRKEWDEKSFKSQLPNHITDFKGYVQHKSEYGQNTSFESSAKKLSFWAAFWPTSLFWTMLNDPIRKFFNWLIMTVFVGAYRKMHWQMVGKHLEG